MVLFSEFSWPTPAFIAITLLTGYAFLRRRSLLRANPYNLPYPPGPKPWPLIGNISDIASSNQAEAYQDLAKRYGDLVFLSVLGINILFVNSFRHASELFEKRSANYSDRGTTVMSNELMGWNFSFGHMRYGDRWKKHRRTFHRQFQRSVAPNYWPKQRKEAHSLLRRLLHSPHELVGHLRQNAAAVIMGVTYGISISSINDRYIAIAEKALDGMAKAASPGAFLVDLIPILKYVPEWVPGASFKRRAREWRDAVLEMKEAPFATVVDAMKAGSAVPSFTSNLLGDLDAKEAVTDDIETIKNCAGLAYAAGAESVGAGHHGINAQANRTGQTVSTLATFVLAILTHPEVQVKAQQELDSVVGRDRLPEFSDRASLPYINAIVKEVLRWNPVAPLGLPHMATKDDHYNGYFIPAGTIVVGNSWGILHDPNLYPDPHRFNPDRFIGDSDNQHLSPVDPLSVAFGYGRRMCPGRHMAEAQVWITIACISSVFDISPAVDANGCKVGVTPAFSSGMISHPLPFQSSMKPRSKGARVLIEQTEFDF